MQDAYITMLTALSSGIMGGTVALLGVYFTNQSNETRLHIQLEREENQRKADLFRDRGEELYELIDKWLNSLTGYYFRRVSVMQGNLTYNQCLDMDIKGGKDNSYNFGRIEMIIDVYFQSIRDSYDKVISDRDELNKIVSEHKMNYMQGNIDGTRFLKPFIKLQLKFGEDEESLKLKIREAIRAV